MSFVCHWTTRRDPRGLKKSPRAHISDVLISRSDAKVGTVLQLLHDLKLRMGLFSVAVPQENDTLCLLTISCSSSHQMALQNTVKPLFLPSLTQQHFPQQRA